ncbi:class I SAM-dependent methyltransferase [Pseudidiomarina sp. 1APR75-33.1]|uniref:class I SAM-dependent methyltransferase n=1 Tax=Pseudidiomarina terrestris TaxID=2820060 RepID=UPI00264CF164|nr:class I SAM-dependent methyltransferase [Pseudidiomarina sp. 1APR75-33.1]MDN7125972.1 class I SAM-dependent methyltransferase [Pseudidiomarina sp. 1APR75-33.1]
MDSTIRFYSENADEFSRQYDSLSFAQVHGDWLHLLDEIPSGTQVLDIGAGSGRDARALAKRGLQVTAVEPAAALRALAQEKSAGINWVDDTLPDLESLDSRYGLVLVSAVWMHLNLFGQIESLKRITELVEQNGYLILTLRHGTFADEREGHVLSEKHILESAEGLGLHLAFSTDNSDLLERKDVRWQTLVFQNRA